MKLNIALTALIAASSVVSASPAGFFKKAQSSSNVSNASNSTTTHNSTNSTNSTTRHSTLQVIFTGGRFPLTNTSSVNATNYTSSTSGTNYTSLFNETSSLSITQLYSIADFVNGTTANNNTKGTVIVTNENSLEALGFFAAIVFNSSKPIVVGTDATLATIVANNTKAANRGALVVDDQGIIYSGIFAPTFGQPASSIPVGAIDDQKNVTWYFDASLPTFIANNSLLRTNFSNFTNTNSLENTEATPIIPIIYDAGYNQDLISSIDSDLVSSVASSINALVVVSSGASTNSTTAQLLSDYVPVVYTEFSPLAIVSERDVPIGAISGGYLTPVKAQVFLGIAIANGVNTTTSIAGLLY